MDPRLLADLEASATFSILDALIKLSSNCSKTGRFGMSFWTSLLKASNTCLSADTLIDFMSGTTGTDQKGLE